jgi:hypothetical protein
VPVEDTLNSTNVVAMPPNGSDPEFLVAIAYDTPSTQSHFQSGRELGLFLELARALTVAVPDHSVGFAALGAESADHRGTRRLAQFLLDEELDPSVLIIQFASLGAPSDLSVLGSCGGDSQAGSVATSLTEGECIDTDFREEPISEAGFQLTYLSGDIEEMGAGLLDFLVRAQS